jgi:tRNA-specific 2-thiouridylase
MVQVRAHGEPMHARVETESGRLEILLDTPATGIAPGQAAVLYQGDRVLGSATISATRT